MPPTCLRTIQPTSKMLCNYTNSTHKMQLIRVLDNHNCHYEKVIFPQQRILFEAILEGRLEVYIEQEGKPMLQEIFSCHNLHQCQQKLNSI